jgi:hypothetical protein
MVNMQQAHAEFSAPAIARHQQDAVDAPTAAAVWAASVEKQLLDRCMQAWI